MGAASESSTVGVALPRGTVTLVMTDIEGSTRLLQRLGRDYVRVLTDHARLVREAGRRHGGTEVDTQGDAFFIAFTRARDAVSAATAIQRGHAARDWPWRGDVRVRIGVHTGEPDVREGGGYVGLDVHRTARICSAAHGGQVVLSHLTATLAADDLPEGVSLRELGEVQLKDLERPEHLTQLVIAGLPDAFPELRGARTTPFHGAEQALAAELATAGAGPPTRVGLEVRLLGPVEVWRGGARVPLSAAKQRMIVAVLALRLGEVVSLDVLIDRLWGERPPRTAQKAVQVYVSELRKLVESDPRAPRVIVSQHPGYRLIAAPDELDLRRFERLWDTGREALAAGDAGAAREPLSDALALWRGPPLAEFRYEDAFSTDIGRLEEMHIGCLEDRIEADLRCGRHASVIGELEALVREHPLRERLCGQLMLALYRSGRQAEALAAYGRARATLVEELGIDPSPDLLRLQRQVLAQDAALVPPAAHPPEATVGTRTVIILSQSSADLVALIDLGAAVSASEGRDLVLARTVTALPGRDVRDRLGEITHRLAEERGKLSSRGVAARVAAFSSTRPAPDITKLATQQEAELLIADGTPALRAGRSGVIDELLELVACDVALHIPRDDPATGDALMVPFGGSEHDWAALELAALLSAPSGAPLVLAGTEAGTRAAPDASRLLATASLVLQRSAGIIAEPLLVPAGAAGMLAAAESAAHLVVGLSPRFREEGLGDTRYRLARDAPAPVTFVRRGTRPGVLAPAGMTRFTWSIADRR